MKRYWGLIDTPFQMMAAWVDEDGRLLRFNLRAKGAEKVDPEAEKNQKKPGPLKGLALATMPVKMLPSEIVRNQRLMIVLFIDFGASE